ncbi:hypothetical protein [Kroppenstedtia eburnea]|uniref:Uncharacterized protein n=1 Tax=Kroppenstedtia eburnea TaxID=714067 RepID=A0A1N7JFL7_9BACL|nr:hypothetical protein [Kroppenstedtia eburnea]QKI80594.1 hypothetical protein GXN75_00340 [Kroppenstedtia eburnea]SIS48051.1 hypothetical protein SAMN05421790_10229 [Kroppenstedtia eburnea]
MAMIEAKVTIKGTRPILWHRFGPEAIPLEKQERTGVAGNDPEEWKKTYTATKSGQLFLDSSYIFGCLRNAAKYTKSGRGSIQNNVAATLQVVEDIVLLDRFMPEELTQDPQEPVYLDVRSVKNPNTKGRNVRYRVAASPGWKATFRITWDPTIVSRRQMEAVIIDAGKLVGLADARSIGFGRFDIESFEVFDDDAEETSA